MIASREEGDERNKTAVSTRAMADSAAGKTEVEKPVEKAVAGASQEVRIVKSVKSAAEQSTAVKADGAKEFKVEKTVTEERAVEDGGAEALKVKHDAVERSPQMRTPQLRRSL